MTGHRVEGCEGSRICGCHCPSCDVARLEAGRILRHLPSAVVLDAGIEKLADILMDLRVDPPGWTPPSTVTYQSASRELAQRILKGLRA